MSFTLNPYFACFLFIGVLVNWYMVFKVRGEVERWDERLALVVIGIVPWLYFAVAAYIELRNKL